MLKARFDEFPGRCSGSLPDVLPGVLMVLGAYAPELSGGGVQCREIIRALHKQVRFTVLTTTRTPTLPRDDAVDGIPVCRVLVDPRRPWTKVGAFVRLTKVFFRRRHAFEIVHFHGYSQKTVLLVALGKLLRKRLVLTLHSAERDDPLAVRAASVFGSRFYGLMDYFIGVSPHLQQRFHESGLRKGTWSLIPNGVDTSRFRPAREGERQALRRQLGLPEKLVLILFVGYFSADKQPHALFEAWKRIRKAGRQVGLVFIGVTDDSSYEVDPAIAARLRSELAAREAEQGVDQDVFFIESTQDIERYFRAVDVYVLPSKREGLPVALLEAMACGLPCVATRLHGSTDSIIEHGKNGLLVPVGNVAEMTAALERMFSDPEVARALGRAARETVAARFSVQTTAGRLLDVYARLAGAPAASAAPGVRQAG